MKRIALIILLLIMMLFCTACSETSCIRVDLVPTIWTKDTISIKLRSNHQFAEVPYSIEETENGYDIIIHCVKTQQTIY